MPYILSLYKQRSNFFLYESFPHTALVIWDELKYTLLWWLHNFFLFCHLFWRHNLTGSVISSFQVLSHQDCHSLCIRHQRCSSHNHQYITISSSQLCELNDTTGKMFPRNMIQKKRFKFYEDCVSWANSYSRHSWSSEVNST